MNRRGNCYVTCEALYHLLGGRDAGYSIYRMRHEGDTHWFLKLKDSIIDPTVSQFKEKPNYSQAVKTGFLTKFPSKRAKELMERLVWQL